MITIKSKSNQKKAQLQLTGTSREKNVFSVNKLLANGVMKKRQKAMTKGDTYSVNERKKKCEHESSEIVFHFKVFYYTKSNSTSLALQHVRAVLYGIWNQRAKYEAK